MRIAITGANGYVGGRIVAVLAAEGHEVRRLVRRPEPGRGDAMFALGEPVPAAGLAGVELLIHAAHDFQPPRETELRRVNVEGTRRLFDAAAAAGVRRLLFVSSIASYEGSHSAYGRAKYDLEQETASRGGSSIRPGTVFGSPPGALFASLERAVRVLPMLPDFGSRSRLFLVHLEDLVRVVSSWVARPGDPPGLIRAAHPRLFTLREVLEVIAEAFHRRPMFVPTPAPALLAGLRAVESLGVTLPFRSDSLVSMLHGNPDPRLSDEVLGVTLRPLAAETLRGAP